MHFLYIDRHDDYKDYKPGSECTNELITDLTTSLVSTANATSHLYEHGHQLGFALQLLPQCLAAALQQGSVNFIEPALVVLVIAGILQQPDIIF